MTTGGEVWRDIPGYEGRYQVSNIGNVRSISRALSRKIGRGLTPNRQVLARLGGRVLSPGIASNGYLTVSLAPERRTYCVHDLVLSAFAGSRPGRHVCRHLDGNKLNNQIQNLAWGTYAENADDMARHGTRVRGESYASSRLDDRAAQIVRALKKIIPQSVLARFFGVSPAAVQAIHDGRTWTHVPDILPAEAIDEINAVRAAIKRAYDERCAA